MDSGVLMDDNVLAEYTGMVLTAVFLQASHSRLFGYFDTVYPVCHE